MTSHAIPTPKLGFHEQECVVKLKTAWRRLQRLSLVAVEQGSKVCDFALTIFFLAKVPVMTSIMVWRWRRLIGPMARSFLGICLGFLIDSSTLGQDATQQPETDREIQWATGSEFRRQLAQDVRVTWRGVPLRDALDRLAQLHRTAFFLDRHVDPELRISLETNGATVQRTIEQLTDRLGLGIAYVGPVIYIGPHYVCDRLSTLTVKRNDEVKSMTAATKRIWRRRRAWGWPRLAEPRQILTQLASTHGLEIKNEQALPYDLWRGESLPPMTLPEKLTLLLSGFQMSYGLDQDGKVLLTRFPSAVAIKRSYTLPNDQSLQDRIHGEFPQAHIEIDGRQLVMESTIEDHWRVAEMLGTRTRPLASSADSAETSTTDVDDSNQRYTLKIVNQPLAKVLKAIAKQLNFQVEYSSDVEANPQQLVSISVHQVTIDELLDAILKPASLAHQRTGTRLRILRATE